MHVRFSKSASNVSHFCSGRVEKSNILNPENQPKLTITVHIYILLKVFQSHPFPSRTTWHGSHPAVR